MLKKKIREIINNNIDIGKGYKGGYQIQTNLNIEEVKTKKELIDEVYKLSNQADISSIAISCFYKDYGQWYLEEGNIEVYNSNKE